MKNHSRIAMQSFSISDHFAIVKDPVLEPKQQLFLVSIRDNVTFTIFEYIFGVVEDNS